MTVAVVGLGKMGGAMAARLVAHGVDVTGWDVDPAARERAQAAGVRVAASAAAAIGGVETVITSVTADEQVRAFVHREDGVAGADVRDTLFLEMSTLQPATVRDLAPVLAARGASIVDAPVLGTIPAARDGQLVALAGGSDADLDRATAVLEPLTKRVVRMGPLGAGHAMKLVANLGLAAYVQALAEGLALGASEGLDLGQMLGVLGNGITASPWLAGKSGVLAGDPAEPTLDVRSIRKDVMSIVATGARNGVPMPLASGTLAALSAAVAAGHAKDDLAEIPRFFRDDLIQRFES